MGKKINELWDAVNSVYGCHAKGVSGWRVYDNFHIFWRVARMHACTSKDSPTPMIAVCRIELWIKEEG